MTRRALLPLCLLLGCLLTFGTSAADAEDMTERISITAVGIETELLTDDSINKAAKGENVTLTLQSETPMGGIWLLYHNAPENGMLDGETPIGTNGFWSEFVALRGAQHAELTFSAVSICELYVYSEGELPQNVQRWEVGDTETDLMLFSTHSDDDQLFFAGLLPYYAARGDCNLRVCLFVSHDGDPRRIQEMLAGLWHCGITVYPIILGYPDVYSESLALAKQQMEARGYPYASIVEAMRDILNEYRPLVAVLHDFAGEYGHGQHQLYAAAVAEAVSTASAEDFIPEKIYVHLYGQNKIVLPIDEPLEALGDKSAFAVSAEAFRYHKSQHWMWFYDWFYGESGEITRAAEIKWYCPAYYGLYYTRVGADSGNDMLENILPYAARRQAAQAAAEAEAAWQRAVCAWTRVEERLQAQEADALRRAAARSAYLSAMAVTPTEPSAAKTQREQGAQLLRVAVIFAAAVLLLTVLLSVCARMRRRK